MGSGLSSCCNSKTVVDTTLDLSATHREALATWLRQNVPVTDVYDIVETLGEGHMGVVYKIKRKVESDGLHNELTRLKSHKAEAEGVDNTDARSSTHSIDSASSKRFRKDSSFKGLKEDILTTTSSPIPYVKKSLHDDDVRVHHVPTALEENGKLRGILRNVSHQSSHTAGSDRSNLVLKHAYHADDDDDDDEEEEDNDKKEEHDIPSQNVTHLERQDSLRLERSRKLITHFNTDIPSEGSDKKEEHHDEIIVQYETDAEQDHMRKHGKWVPTRTIRFQRLYACKTISTGHMQKDQMKELMNEIYMMRKMDHPYIIRLYEVYQEDSNLWLVMDLCTGGNLTSRKLQELEVVVIAEQILRAVSYLHVRGIFHRDLKLENILYENSSKNSTVRLIDFGISQTYEKQTGEKKPYRGAAYTMSPEVASGGQYTSKSDVWSVGVIVWILLAGDYPFLRTEDDLKNESKIQKLIDGDYSFGITWKGRGISENAKSFVKGCLVKDPEKRWGAIDALAFLQDEWIPVLEEKGQKELEQMEKDLAAHPSPVNPKSPVRTFSESKLKDPSAVLKQTFASKVKKEHKLFHRDIISDIRRYIDYGLLKKIILLTIANMMDRQDVGRIQEAFLLADTNHSGTITKPELKEAFHNIDDDELERIFSGLDHDQSGQIHYAEFLAALVEGEGLVTKDRLSDAFDRIDMDGKGYITHADLKVILGHSYDKSVVDRMIDEGDFKKNNRVEFDELLTLMQTQDKNRIAETMNLHE